MDDRRLERADLDTILSLKTQRHVSSSFRFRFNLRSVLLNFQSFTEKPVFDCAFAHPITLFYHIWLKAIWIKPLICKLAMKMVSNAHVYQLTVTASLNAVL